MPAVAVLTSILALGTRRPVPWRRAATEDLRPKGTPSDVTDRSCHGLGRLEGPKPFLGANVSAAARLECPFLGRKRPCVAFSGWRRPPSCPPERGAPKGQGSERPLGTHAAEIPLRHPSPRRRGRLRQCLRRMIWYEAPMISKYLATLAVAVFLVTIGASSLQFATRSQVLGGKAVDETLRLEFTIDADSSHT